MAYQPIPFLQPDDQGQFHVCKEAAKILEKIRTPVAVVCVAGPYRTGKSYLLNRLIHNENAPPPPQQKQQGNGKGQQQAGFSVGNTINACTKGIWLWSEPYYNKSNNTTYLFLDTEGLNSTGEEVTFDTQIFSLSVLLSSIFILNTQNSITESELEQLELVAECSKKISFTNDAATSQQDNDEDDDTIDYKLALHFPRLIWVLRDFALQLVDKDGSKLTPNQYLERTLSPLPQTGKKSVEEKNRIRKCIRDCFIKRDCLPLPRPVTDESLLHRLQDLSIDELRPEFQSGIRQLKIRLLQLADHFKNGQQPQSQGSQQDVTKYINNKPVTGDVLLGLAYAYCDAINSGEVPTILSAWQSVVETKKLSEIDQYKSQIEEFLYSFTKNITNLDNAELDIDIIYNKYQLLLKKILKALHQTFPGDDESIKNVYERIQKDSEKVFQQVSDHVEMLVADYNNKLIDIILNSLEETSGMTYKELLSHLSTVELRNDNDIETLPDTPQYTQKELGVEMLKLVRDIIVLFHSRCKGSKSNNNNASHNYKRLALERNIIEELTNIIIKAQSNTIYSLTHNIVEQFQSIQKMTQNIKNLKQQLEQEEILIKQYQTDLHQAELKQQTLQQQLETSQMKTEQLLDNKNKLNKKVEKLENQYDEMINMNKSLEKDILQYKTDLITKQHNEELLQQKIKAIDTEYQKMLTQYEKTVDTKQQYQIKIDTLQQQLQELTLDNKNNTNIIEQLTNKINKKDEKMAKLQSKIMELNRHIEQLTNDIQNLQQNTNQRENDTINKINQLQKEKEILQNDIEKLNTQNKAMNNEFNNTQLELQNKYTQLNTKYQTLKDKYDNDIKNNTNNFNQEKLSLQEQIKTLTQQLNDAEDDKEKALDELQEELQKDLDLALEEQRVELEESKQAEVLLLQQASEVLLRERDDELEELHKKVTSLEKQLQNVKINTNKNTTTKGTTMSDDIMHDDDYPPSYATEDYYANDDVLQHDGDDIDMDVSSVATHNSSASLFSNKPQKRKAPSLPAPTSSSAVAASNNNNNKNTKSKNTSQQQQQQQDEKKNVKKARHTFDHDNDDNDEEEEEKKLTRRLSTQHRLSTMHLPGDTTSSDDEEEEEDENGEIGHKKTKTTSSSAKTTTTTNANANNKKQNSKWEKPYTAPSPLKMPDQEKILARRRRDGSLFPDDQDDDVDNNNNTKNNNKNKKSSSQQQELSGDDDDDSNSDSDDEMITKKNTNSNTKKTIVNKRSSIAAAKAGGFISSDDDSNSEQNESEEEEAPVVSKKKPTTTTTTAKKGAAVVVAKKKVTATTTTTTTTAAPAAKPTKTTAAATKTKPTSTHGAFDPIAFKKTAEESWKVNEEEEYRKLREKEEQPVQSGKKKASTAAAASSSNKKKTVPMDAEPVRDPKALSVIELKRWLTSLDVPLPQKAKKDDLIKLLYENDPRL